MKKRIVEREEGKEEGREGLQKKRNGTRAVQLPEKLISRGKEGAPAGWLSGTLPCSTGCRGARKRRMAMVRGAANGKVEETLFFKSDFPPTFRQRGRFGGRRKRGKILDASLANRVLDEETRPRTRSRSRVATKTARPTSGI